MWGGDDNFDLAKTIAEGFGRWDEVLEPLRTLKNYSQRAHLEDKAFLKTEFWNFKSPVYDLRRPHPLNVYPVMATLPENITRLTHLKWMNICCVGLESLPENMSALHRLERLLCTNNKLKTLPQSLFQLKNLSSLEAHYNQIETLPANFWTGMNDTITYNSIRLSHNRLQALPEIHTPTANIYDLDFSFNQLSTLFQNFKHLRGVQQLKLSNNQLQTLPESIGDAPFTHVFVSNNQLKTLPESLFKNPDLKLVDARKNPISLREQKKIYQWVSDQVKILL